MGYLRCNFQKNQIMKKIYDYNKSKFANNNFVEKIIKYFLQRGIYYVEK